MRKVKLSSLFLLFALLASMVGNTLPVYADDNKPPTTPVPLRPPVDVTVTVEESTTTIQGPSDSNPSKPEGHIQPNSVLPGPSGQSGTLTSQLSYYQSGGWLQQGSSVISLNGNGSSIVAKAWTTLYDNGWQQQSTAANPCWTYTTCTSSTQYWVIGSGHTGSNTAETVITWYDSTQGYGSATVSHTY